jgi:hypothetical protein
LAAPSAECTGNPVTPINLPRQPGFAQVAQPQGEIVGGPFQAQAGLEKMEVEAGIAYLLDHTQNQPFGRSRPLQNTPPT